MVIVHGLRILSELSFYYAFASFIAVCYGGRYALTGLVLQVVCFALSAALEKRRWLRLAALLPMGLFWLLPNVPLADTLLFLPPAAYLIWLAYAGSYPLQWGRHVELFSVFWKSYAGFAFILLLTGMMKELSAASVPIALIMLVSSVLLMRTLRHEPETYCRMRYQLVNAASVAAVMAVAALMSTEAFLETCLTACTTAYQTIVLPLLLLALTGFFYVLKALSWLVSLLNIQLPISENPPELQLDGIAKDLGLDTTITGDPVGKEILIALMVLVVVALLYLFFRWMMRISWREAPPLDAREERINAVDNSAAGGQRARPGTAVQRVRAQYRKFLKLYVSTGGELDDTHTSMDVQRGAQRRRFDPENTEELRDIYIRARYGEHAEPQDAARAKELYAAMKKERRSQAR